MAGKVVANQIQLGDSSTATQNFVLQTNVDGSAKLARGNAGVTTQDILTVDSSGNPMAGPTAAGYAAANRVVVGSNGASSSMFALLNGGTNRGYLYADATDTTLWSEGTRNLNLGTASAGPIKFTTNNILQATLDTSGNLGLGVTPSAWISSWKALQQQGITVASSSTIGVVGQNWYINSGGTDIYQTSNFASLYKQTGGAHAWMTAPSGTAGNPITFTQAMTLDASGNLLVGKTAVSDSSGLGAYISAAGVVTCTLSASTSVASTYNVYSTGAAAYRFYVGLGGQINATSTSIAAISDASLKENIRDLDTGLAQVMALRPRRFDWKEETKLDQKNVAGFIAQELETVLPELVYDYQYSEGVTKKSIKMGDILPTLVKAIQEQQAQIQELKAEFDAYKAAHP